MIPDKTDSLNNSYIEIDKVMPSLQVTLTSAPTVSYAAVQNRVPIIQSIRIENRSDVDINNIDLVISANPSFMLGQRFYFERLIAGEVRTLNADFLDLKPDHAYFAALRNEKELGRIDVRITTSDSAETFVTNIIEVLAHNEWGGTRGLPELLAAFVQPNSLGIDRLLGLASNLLKQSDRSFLSLDALSVEAS